MIYILLFITFIIVFNIIIIIWHGFNIVSSNSYSILESYALSNLYYYSSYKGTCTLNTHDNTPVRFNKFKFNLFVVWPPNIISWFGVIERSGVEENNQYYLVPKWSKHYKLFKKVRALDKKQRKQNQDPDYFKL